MSQIVNSFWADILPISIYDFPPFLVNHLFTERKHSTASLWHTVLSTLLVLALGCDSVTQGSHEHKHYDIATVDLATEVPTQWVMGRYWFSVDPADNGMIHTTIRTQQNGEMIHNATQISMQFCTDELFIYGIFSLNILDCSWLHRLETIDCDGSTCILLQ